MNKLQFPFATLNEMELALGVIPNTRELAKATPDEFRDRYNKWHDFAATLFYSGGSLGDESNYINPELVVEQKTFLHACLSSWDFRHEDKMAVGGWLLSLMLKDVPNQ